MDLHPNWIALATVDFEHRIFVREQNLNENEKPKKVKRENPNVLSGDDAKNFYLDVISTPDTKKDITTPSIHTKSVSKPINIISDVDNRTQNKFLLAAQENDVEILKDLLRRCPKILNTTDDYGWTALMCAVQSSSIESIKFLLSCEADTKITDNLGRNAFTLAANNEHVMQIITKHSSFKKFKSKRIHQPPVDFFCDICKQNFKEDPKKHCTSVLHFFNSNKNVKMRTFYGIPESNRGYQLMLKKGWNRETGLGPKGHGNKYPIKTIHKLNRHGIGIETDVPKVTHKPKMDSEIRKLKKQNKIDRRNKNKISQEKNIDRILREELS